MKSFIQFLEERAFAKAVDQDFTVDETYVVIISEKDAEQYRETRDKLHGSGSHALKHLPEFNPQLMREIITKLTTVIVDYFTKNPGEYIAIMKRGGNVVHVGAKDVLPRLTPYMIGNTLDVINDKVLAKKPLTPLEKQLKPFLDILDKEYTRLIEAKIKQAKPLGDKFEGVIKIDGFQNGVPKEFYLDFSDYSLIICTPDYVRTMFKVERAHDVKSLLQDFMRRKIDVDDKNILGKIRSVLK